jgi:hypothetical protein
MWDDSSKIIKKGKVNMIDKPYRVMITILCALNIMLCLHCKNQRESSCINNAEASLLQACLLQRNDASGSPQTFSTEICFIEISDYMKCKKKP